MTDNRSLFSLASTLQEPDTQRQAPAGTRGSQILSLRLRCVLASCWYQLLGNRLCFHRGGYKPSMFRRLVVTAYEGLVFSPPARPLGRWARHPFILATSSPLCHAGSSCCSITSETRCFHPGGTNCMTPLCIKGPH